MFKNPFSFNGRIRRLEYWLSNLIFVAGYLLIAPYMQFGDLVEKMIVLVAYIPLLWFIFAQGAKRCHDKGVNGWWQLLPFYGLVLLFYRGDEGANKYDIDLEPIYDMDDDGIAKIEN